MTRTTHRILSALLVLVLAVSLAVPALAVETVKVTDVALDKTLVTLAPGETVTLVPVITPADATNQKVSWKTNKSAVATVKDGVVTAKAPGTADITVTTSDGMATRMRAESSHLCANPGEVLALKCCTPIPRRKTREATAMD